MPKNKKIKVLVVGGTGFIGYHLARRCLKLNWKKYMKIFNYN